MNDNIPQRDEGQHLVHLKPREPLCTSCITLDLDATKLLEENGKGEIKCVLKKVSCPAKRHCNSYIKKPEEEVRGKPKARKSNKKKLQTKKRAKK